MTISRQISVGVLLAATACFSSSCKRNSSSTSSSGAPAPGVSSQAGWIARLDPALDAVIAPDTKLEKVAGGFQFTEGPMWREDRLWFSDLVGNKMYAVSPEAKVELLMDHSGGLKDVPAQSYKGSNAMVTAQDGSVLMCQHGLRRIVRLDEQLRPRLFLDRWEGKRFNSPNDLVFAPDGALWFTDPPFGLDKQALDPAKEIPFSGVYRFSRGKLTAVITDLPNPNGIGFSPDGRTLYVSNSGPKMFVNRYSVGPNGTVGPASLLISYPEAANNGVPDGLKLDSAGNVWSTGPGGIRIITPEGKVLGQIRVPEVAANLAWANDGRTLYITASSSVYRLQVKVRGQRPLYGR